MKAFLDACDYAHYKWRTFSNDDRRYMNKKRTLRNYFYLWLKLYFRRKAENFI